MNNNVHKISRVIYMKFPFVQNDLTYDGRTHLVSPVSLRRIIGSNNSSEYYLLEYYDFTQNGSRSITILTRRNGRVLKVPLTSYDMLSSFLEEYQLEDVDLSSVFGPSNQIDCTNLTNIFDIGNDLNGKKPDLLVIDGPIFYIPIEVARQNGIGVSEQNTIRYTYGPYYEWVSITMEEFDRLKGKYNISMISRVAEDVKTQTPPPAPPEPPKPIFSDYEKFNPKPDEEPNANIMMEPDEWKPIPQILYDRKLDYYFIDEGLAEMYHVPSDEYNKTISFSYVVNGKQRNLTGLKYCAVDKTSFERLIYIDNPEIRDIFSKCEEVSVSGIDSLTPVVLGVDVSESRDQQYIEYDTLPQRVIDAIPGLTISENNLEANTDKKTKMILLDDETKNRIKNWYLTNYKYLLFNETMTIVRDNEMIR